MKTLVLAILGGLLIVFSQAPLSTVSAQTVPSSAGGFTLGRSIDDYPVESHAYYLNEVIVKDLPGFRKAYITYGTCRNPGKILRLKLKYENGSVDFFKELLSRYREKFGAKPKFSGDQFGNVRSWNWSFTDDQGHRVKLQLQHNLRDEEESIGNMVKLSLPDLMDDERRCFNELHDPDEKSGKKTDWEDLIPR